MTNAPQLPGRLEAGLVIDAVMPDVPLAERLERVAATGFRNVEFWNPVALCPDPAELARLAEHAGVALNSQVLVSPDGRLGGGLVDPSRRAEMLERLRAAFAYGREAGIAAGIICTGNGVEGTSDAAMRQSVVDGLKAAAELAEAEGVTLLLEPLNTAVDHPGYWLASSDLGAEICREVGSPRVKLLFDCYHMEITEGDLAGHIARHADVIGHFHAAGVPGRHEPCVGRLDYGPVVEHIASLGWRGVISLEYRPSIDDHAESLRRSLAALAGAPEG